MQLHYGDYFPFFESDALNLFHCHSQVQVYCLTKLFSSMIHCAVGILSDREGHWFQDLYNRLTQNSLRNDY